MLLRPRSPTRSRQNSRASWRSPRSVALARIRAISAALPWPKRRKPGSPDKETSRAGSPVSLDGARYAALVDATRDAILWLSFPALLQVQASPSCAALLGCADDQIVGRGAFERVHEDDAASLAAYYAAVAENAAALPAFIYRVRHGDGRWLWCEITAGAVRVGTGPAQELICTLRHVDALQRVMAAKSAAEERFRLLAENASELIVFGHDDGNRSYISPASMRLFGFTPEELDVEMRCKRWVHPDDVDTLAWLKFGKAGSEAAVTCRVAHRSGAWVWVEAIVRRISARTENEPTIIATFRDITERQIQAQALRKAKDDADVARLGAEEASRAKSDFLAVMSHEIRTPLNAILGFADLLQTDEVVQGERRRHVERICNAGAALRTVVNDILDFSKLEAGYVGLVMRPLGLRALVDDALSIVEYLACKKQLDLGADLDPAVPEFVVGDYARLRQILVNLLNNAVKFTQQGSVRLTVRIRDAGLRFSVTDTGIGVPRGELDNIFHRFSQVDGTLSREFGGTGLGLAICRRLVEAMNGMIGVESAVQQGSTFWFDLQLPVADDQPQAAPTAVPGSRDLGAFDDLLALAETPPAPRSDAPRSLNILLAEDVVLNQELICCLLQARGHRIDLVGNGSEAIMAVSDKTYDLVLMDLQMPYVDGITAAAAIRYLPHPGRFVPIVALTAAVLREQIDLALTAGMNDVLAKPICLETLEGLLERARRDEIRDPVDPATMDDDAAITLVRALGDAKVRSMRELLRTSLLTRFNAPLSAFNILKLKAEAHASIAGAAMLGFERFATICRSFIQADADKAPQAYAALQRELYQVVRFIESLPDENRLTPDTPMAITNS